MPRTLGLQAAQQSGEFTPLSAIEGIAVDLRYASPHNFVRRDVYSPMDCAWLHREAAQALGHAQVSLATHMPDHRLVVFDALRPHSVQVALYATLQGTGLEMYLAHPDVGSIHSYGMAVDVGILRPDGQELDMGTGFDAMVDASHPALEAQSLASGALTHAQIANRQRLRSAMLSAGFQGIATEWWHFDLGDKAQVRAEYVRVV